MIWIYAYSPAIWLPVFTVIFSLVLSAFAFRRRSLPGALLFAIGCLLAVPLAVSLVLENLAVDMETKIFWFKFMTAWQLPVPTAITCFILEYT